MTPKITTAQELLQAHRDATISRGDIVRTIVALDERLTDLEQRLEDMREANGLFTGR